MERDQSFRDAVADSIEEELADAFRDFHKLLGSEYKGDTARQRLYTVRQFCEYLVTGRKPRLHDIPQWPDRPAR